MKLRTRFSLVATIVALTLWTAGVSFVTARQNVLNYAEQGGSRSVIGGSLDVVSGGDLDVELGAAFKIAGVDQTTAVATAVAGVAAG